jgi:transposase, IS30 family
MGKAYKHLDLDERCKIAQLHEVGASVGQIATALDRPSSTISRELKRNKAKLGYSPGYAEEQARARRWRGSRLERDDELRERVLGDLQKGWSPEQIAGRLKQQKAATTISHESIYRFIYAQVRRTNQGSWRHYLPKAKYRRSRRAHRRRTVDDLIKGRVSIDLRPPEVDRRDTFGHWEADLMLFSTPGQAALVTQERTTRVILLAKQPDKSAQPVAEQLLVWFAPLQGQLCLTITFDNGTEFAQHLDLKDKLGIQTFFCDPHSPWQKGGIENVIGRLRRYLPRKTNLDTIDQTSLEVLVAAYNNTPRKCLGFESPAERFSAKLLHFKCESTPSLRSG